MMHDWDEIRKDFPQLVSLHKGKRLVYLDSAATSQKPQIVVDRLSRFYTSENANIHRGMYPLSENALTAYIESKKTIASCIHAETWQSIIYTRNTTESINTAAYLLEKKIKPGDEILVSIMEHHSNLIPWMNVCKRTGAVLSYIPVTEDGHIDMDVFRQMLHKNTKILACCHVSNVLGSINDIKEIISLCKMNHTLTVIDGAQAVGHMEVNVSDLDPDIYAFSGHKVLAPFGIGVLYMKEDLMEECDPLFYGGDMVSYVDISHIEYNELPWKFEAGTGSIGDAVALQAGIDYINHIGIQSIHEHNKELTHTLVLGLQRIPGITVYGPKERSSLASFSIAGIHPHDISALLAESNICIRAGMHCAQPLLASLGCSALSRVSIHFYNNEEDINSCIEGIEHAIHLLKHG